MMQKPIQIYYAGSGFYSSAIHDPEQIPENAVAIDEATYQSLLDGQANGQVINPPDATHPLPYLSDPPPPSMEEQQTAFIAAIQARLDQFAATRNYDNALACATYATSTNPKFAAEGQYMVEARDATWAKGYALLDEVLAGKRPLPTMEEVMAEMPPLIWPDSTATTGGA